MPNAVQEIDFNSNAAPLESQGGVLQFLDQGINKFILDTGGATAGTFAICLGSFINNPDAVYGRFFLNIDVTDLATSVPSNTGSKASATSLGGNLYLIDFTVGYGATDQGYGIFFISNDATTGGTGVTIQAPTCNFNDFASIIQSVIESLPSIGSGNVVVTEILDVSSVRVGLTITYQGALANTAMPMLGVISGLLKTANTINVNLHAQDGISDVADDPVTPTLSIATVAAVTPVSAIQEIDTTGGLGTCGISGNGFPEEDVTFTGGDDTFSIQSAMDVMWGGGNTAVSYLGGTLYNIAFQSTYGSQPIPLMTIVNDFTVGGSGVTLTDDIIGAIGVYQHNELTFSEVPTAGTYDLVARSSPTTFHYYDGASALQASYPAIGTFPGLTVTGDYSGGFDFTLNDGSTFGTYNDGEDYVYNYGSLVIPGSTGRPQEFSFELADNPCAGGIILENDGNSSTVDITATMLSGNLLIWPNSNYTYAGGTGFSGNPAYYQQNYNGPDSDFSVTEDTTTPNHLLHFMLIELVDVTDGGSGGGPYDTTMELPLLRTFSLPLSLEMDLTLLDYTIILGIQGIQFFPLEIELEQDVIDRAATIPLIRFRT